MNNQEALAYIDRLWNNYGALYSDEKNAEHEEEAELMQKYFMSLGAAKEAIKALEQEPFKPMVEIDLYSVIKQKYIEREVLDKIRAEIERQEKWLMDAGYNQYNVDIALDTIKSVVDKYRAETEDT